MHKVYVQKSTCPMTFQIIFCWISSKTSPQYSQTAEPINDSLHCFLHSLLAIDHAGIYFSWRVKMTATATTRNFGKAASSRLKLYFWSLSWQETLWGISRQLIYLIYFDPHVSPPPQKVLNLHSVLSKHVYTVIHEERKRALSLTQAPCVIGKWTTCLSSASRVRFHEKKPRKTIQRSCPSVRWWESLPRSFLQDFSYQRQNVMFFIFVSRLTNNRMTCYTKKGREKMLLFFSLIYTFLLLCPIFFPFLFFSYILLLRP